ncbi:MAG: rRNA maturation RNase YbeY [Gammaproteobacteria bacterium]|nr:rRNA maturation RNase YbeY [Gammaproteobacteria bacterium]
MKPTDHLLVVDVSSSIVCGVPPRVSLVRWARTAAGARGRGWEIVIRVVGLAEGRRLNAVWQGKDYATNVLSFPAHPSTLIHQHLTGFTLKPMGDLVICAPVLVREARAQGKLLKAHWAHMVVHGVLHLLGYDHAYDAETRRMERRERQILRIFGLPNPYAAI